MDVANDLRSELFVDSFKSLHTVKWPPSGMVIVFFGLLCCWNRSSDVAMMVRAILGESAREQVSPGRQETQTQEREKYKHAIFNERKKKKNKKKEEEGEKKKKNKKKKMMKEMHHHPLLSLHHHRHPLLSLHTRKAGPCRSPPGSTSSVRARFLA
jgi:hypothetical protein